MVRLVSGALALACILASSLVNAPQARAATVPPGAPTGVTATAGTISATVRWTPADATATTFTVVSSPGGVSASVLGTASTATVTGLGFGLAYTFTVYGTNSAGAGSSSGASNSVTPLPPGSPYHALPSFPLLNTDVTAGKPLSSNLGDDPAHFPGLTAVVLNVTASQATIGTTVQLMLNQQVAQSIPVAVGQQQSTLAVIAVPAQLTQGAVQVTSGKAHVELDFEGFFTGPSTLQGHTGMLQMIPAGTLFSGSIATGASTDIPVLGQGGVPSGHVAAVLLNVTASGSAAPGAVSLRPSGSLPTGATAVGFGSGQTSANRAIVPVATNGAITLTDRGAAANAKVEALGWVTDGTDATAFGSVYTPVAAARLLDTTVTGGPLLAGDSVSFPVWGKGGAPDQNSTSPPTSAVLLVTALSPTGTGSLVLGGASVVDFGLGGSVSSSDVVKLELDGSTSVSVTGANTNVTVDLVGYFSGDLIVPGSTKVLTAVQLAGITGLTDTSMTFAAGVQVSPPIMLNDVVNAGISPTTPFGLLRRVLAIGTDAIGQIVFTTRNAALPEALTSYDVSWTQPPTAGAFGFHQAVTRPGAASLPPFQPPPGTSIDPRWPVLTIAGNGHHLLFPVSASFSALSGQLDISDLELQLVPHLAIGKSPFTNPQFAVGLSAGVRFHADVSLSGQLAGQTWTPFDEEHRSPPQDVPVGPIQLVVQGLIELKITVDLTLTASIGATIVADKYGLITAGYDNGAFFGNFKGFDYIPPGKTISGPNFSLAAEVRPGVHFIGGVVLYNFAVLAGDENPYVRFTVDPLSTPWWSIAEGVCKHIVIGIDIDFVLGQVKNEATIDLPCDEVVIFQAPGPKIGIAITPSPATVQRGGTLHLTATTDSNSQHGVLWSIDANNGTLSNVTITSADYTAPSRAGTYVVHTAAVDDPTSTQDVKITVTAVAPSPATNVTATLAGSTTVNVSWAAPTDNGGAPIQDYKVVASDGTTVDAGNSTFVNFINLTPGTTYTFIVVAYNAENFSSTAVSAPVTIPTQAVVTLSPTSIDFGPNQLGSPTQPQTVTVSVSGGTLLITSLSLGGLRPTDYSIVADQCTGVTLDPQGSCTFGVVFTAAVQGQSNATALVTDDAPDSPQSVALQGEGPQPVINGFFTAGQARFFDAQNGTVGNFNTADGGKTWSPQRLPTGGTSPQVFMLDPLNGWALVVAPPFTSGCFNGANCKIVMRTADGGVTWTRLTTINFLVPQELVFTDLSHGWIAGSGNVGCVPGTTCVAVQLYQTTDGGVTWTPQVLANPVACAATQTLIFRSRQVVMLDASNGWVLGQTFCNTTTNGTVSSETLTWSTNDGGATWTVHDTGLTLNQFVSSSLHAVSPTQVAVTIQDLGSSSSGEGAPFFVQTTDGGATWTRSAIPDAFAGEFQYVDASHIDLIAGANGAQSIYSSADGGQTWTRVGALPGSVISSNPNFTEIHFLTVVDATHWWTTGQIDYLSGTTNSGGLILFSSDGGVTWTIVLEGSGS